MKITVTYENGVLKPHARLHLVEHAQVEIDVPQTGPSDGDTIGVVSMTADAFDRLFDRVAMGGDALRDSEAYNDEP